MHTRNAYYKKVESSISVVINGKPSTKSIKVETSIRNEKSIRFSVIMNKLDKNGCVFGIQFSMTDSTKRISIVVLFIR